MRGCETKRAPLTARAVCSPQTVGKCGGNWVPFGRGHDQAGDQRRRRRCARWFSRRRRSMRRSRSWARRSSRSMSRPTGRWRTWWFGCAMCIRPVNCCASALACSTSRIATDTKNPNRWRRESATACASSSTMPARCSRPATGSGSRYPPTYWPMIWPCPEKATLTISGGTLDLPVRPPQAADALLSPLPGPESAPPEKPTMVRRGDMRIERIDRHRPGTGRRGQDRGITSRRTIRSAQSAELQRTQTMSREAWQVRIETQMRLSCTRDAFLLRA